LEGRFIKTLFVLLKPKKPPLCQKNVPPFLKDLSILKEMDKRVDLLLEFLIYWEKRPPLNNEEAEAFLVFLSREQLEFVLTLLNLYSVVWLENDPEEVQRHLTSVSGVEPTSADYKSHFDLTATLAFQIDTFLNENPLDASEIFALYEVKYYKKLLNEQKEAFGPNNPNA